MLEGYTMDEDFKRKVRERYGDREYTLLHTFAFPDEIEGGSGACAVILFEDGKVSAWLNVSGLYYETDAAEVESYYAKVPPPWPVVVTETIGLLIAQQPLNPPRGVTPSDAQAIIAQRGAIQHKAYLADPTPPDISSDILDDGERTADLS